MEIATPDDYINYLESTGEVEVFDYTKSIFNNKYFCFHVKLFRNGKVYDGVATSISEVEAATKACAEVLERLIYGKLSDSKFIFGSSFHPNILTSKTNALNELVERYIFSQYLKDKSYSEVYNYGDSIIYEYSVEKYTLLVCEISSSGVLGRGFSLKSDDSSQLKAYLEAKRRFMFFYRDRKTSDIPIVKNKKVLKLKMTFPETNWKYKKIGKLGFSSKLYFSTNISEFKRDLELIVSFTRSSNGKIQRKSERV